MIALRESMADQPVSEVEPTVAEESVKKTRSRKSGKKRRHRKRGRQSRGISPSSAAPSEDLDLTKKAPVAASKSQQPGNGNGVVQDALFSESERSGNDHVSEEDHEPDRSFEIEDRNNLSKPALIEVPKTVMDSEAGLSDTPKGSQDTNEDTDQDSLVDSNVPSDSDLDSDDYLSEDSDFEVSDSSGKKGRGRREKGRSKEDKRKDRVSKEPPMISGRSGWDRILEGLVSDYVRSTKKEMVKGVGSVLHMETAVPEAYRDPPINRDNLNRPQWEGLLLARYQIFVGLSSLGNEYAADQGLDPTLFTELDGHHIAAAINKLNMPIKLEDSCLMIKALDEGESLITNRTVDEGKRSLFLQRISQLELLARWPSDDEEPANAAAAQGSSRSPPGGNEDIDKNRQGDNRQVDERGFLLPGNSFAPTKKRKKARVDAIYRKPLPAYDYKNSPPEYYTKIPWDCWCSIFDRIKLRVQPNGIVW